MVRSAMLLTPVFPELGGEAKPLSEQLNDLMRVMTSIRTEGEKLRAETARLNDARMRLAGLQETKRQSLAERQAELAQVRQAAAEISKSVVGPERPDLQARQGGGRTRPGSAPTSRRSPRRPQPTAEAPPADPKTAGAAAGTLGPDDRGSSVVLAPSSERVAMLTPGRIKPAMPFPDARACCRCRRRAGAS